MAYGTSHYKRLQMTFSPHAEALQIPIFICQEPCEAWYYWIVINLNLKLQRFILFTESCQCTSWIIGAKLAPDLIRPTYMRKLRLHTIAFASGANTQLSTERNDPSIRR